jgi:hypothetical protein
MSLIVMDAADEHFAAIVEIERSAGEDSVVALTEGHALREALDRGHHVVVALDGTAVRGWAWFTTSLERGSEEIGLILRVRTHDEDYGTIELELLRHVSEALSDRGIRLARATLAGDDRRRPLYQEFGFEVSALTMEIEL